MGHKARFGSLLLQLARAVSRLERDQVCCGDLTFQQFETLRRIARSERPNLSSLAADLGIDQSTASRNLARLDRDGYLSRTRHETDARSVAFGLTRKGQSALSNLSCDERDAFGELYDRIPVEHRDSVAGALAVLASALADEVPAECCPPEPKRNNAS